MQFSLRDGVDIFIVAFLLYKLMAVMRGTRAAALLKGLAVVFLFSLLARVLALQTVGWLLEKSTTVILVALPVVFYPELRRALEKIGRGKLFSGWGGIWGDEDGADVGGMIDAVIDAVVTMGQRKVGALIAFEMETGLQEYIETGVMLDAIVSRELLLNLFHPHAPLHDGAAVVGGGRVQAASCFLPLTEAAIVGRLGTRHRAAVGLSEQTDAVVLVVSEETGTISLAVGGQLRRFLGAEHLRELLRECLTDPAVDLLGLRWGAPR